MVEGERVLTKAPLLYKEFCDRNENVYGMIRSSTKIWLLNDTTALCRRGNLLGLRAYIPKELLEWGGC